MAQTIKERELLDKQEEESYDRQQQRLAERKVLVPAHPQSSKHVRVCCQVWLSACVAYASIQRFLLSEGQASLAHRARERGSQSACMAHWVRHR